MATTTIDSKTVKALRDKTNAGMMDCKRALEEANGSLEEAEAILRKKGISTAAKKAGRDAKEGVIASSIQNQGKVGVLVEVNCETDFVAKNDNFKAFTSDIATTLATEPEADLEAKRVDAVAALGENILISRHTKYELGGCGLVASYIHMQGKVAVLVEVGCESDAVAQNDTFKEFVKDINLHIAAANPQFVSRDEVPEDIIAKEREIYKDSDQVKGKPENIIEKIVNGKIDKFLASICLLDQGFIKNPDQSVQDLQDAKAKELGEKLTINRFTRYQVGE